MTWLKDAGEGTAELKVMPAPMRTGSALMPAAESMEMRRVDLSLQSPY